MDQATVNEVKRLESIEYNLDRAHRDQKAAIAGRRRALVKNCDHKFSDGTSAVQQYWLYSGCTICGDNDYGDCI